jgi:hypothetical protein
VVTQWLLGRLHRHVSTLGDSTSDARAEPGLRVVPAKALSGFFKWVLRCRWAVVALYALLLPPSAYFATKVGQDNAIDRIVVPSDADYINNQEFQLRHRQ